MHQYCLIDTEVAGWAEINPTTGLCDQDKPTRQNAWVRLVQHAINGENPTVLDLTTDEGRLGFQQLCRWADDNPEARFVAHGMGFDHPKLTKLGLHILRWDCTLTASLICSAGLGLRHSLDEVIARYTGNRPYDAIDIEGVDGIERKKTILQLSDWGRPELTPAQLQYAALDVGEDYNKTYLALWDKVQAPWFWRSYQLELVGQPTVWQMVANGIRTHLPKWRVYIAERRAELEIVDAWLKAFIDEETQRLFPERFMITLRRKTPRPAKLARVLKDGTIKTPAEAAQVLGDLTIIQPHPALTPLQKVTEHITSLEEGDYRVGYLVREEMGLGHNSKTYFNPNSAEQMRELCDAMLGVVTKDLTFNERVVEDLKRTAIARNCSNVVDLLDKHIYATGLRKIVSTYSDGYWKHADTEGYIHSNIKTVETDTARFCSSEPNLQNLPRDMQATLFCCDEDEVLISADYSAEESRLLMFLGKQDDVYSKIANGMDFHSMTASILSGIPYEQLVTKGVRDKVKPEYVDLRTSAKAGSFAPCYGAGPRRMMDIFRCSYQKAKRFCDNYWKQYPNVKKMQDAQFNTMLDHCYITDLSFGRVRFFNPGAEGLEQLGAGVPKPEVYGKFRNAVFNYSSQSMGATVLRFALIGLQPWLDANEHMRPRLRMTIHDSIKVTVLKEYAVEAADAIRNIMEAAAEFAIPGISIPVDVDIHEKGYPSFAASEVYAPTP